MDMIAIRNNVLLNAPQKRTISGNIVKFNSVINEQDVEATVTISPVQDLHGQNNPYPAGAGKNLFDAEHPNVTYSSGVTYVYNADGSITLSGTADSNATLFFFVLPNTIPFGSVVSFSLNNSTTNNEIGIRLVKRENGTITQWGNNPIYANSANKTYTYNGTGYDANEINLFVKTNHGDVPEITLKIQCEIGSEATDWTPYSNICPISGWDSVQITRTGVNLIPDGTNASNGYVDNKYLIEDGSYYNNATNYYVSEYFEISENTEYTYSITQADTSVSIPNYVSVIFYDADKNVLGGGGTHGQQSRTFTTPTGTVYARASVRKTALLMQFEKGNASTYEPYKGNIYPISLPTTAYGGTLTVNKDGSGKLIVDKAIANASDFTWTYVSSAHYLYATVSDIKRATSGVIPDIISNMYVADVPSTISSGSGKNGTISIGVTTSRILVRDDRYTTSAAFVESGAYFIYPLATPVEFNLTELEVIETLRGINNIWANCGNISITCII